MSTSSSMTSPTAEDCFTRKTPGLELLAPRNSPKCRGMVWKSCDTRMRFWPAAKASTVGSGTPSRFASFAERKSIAGSLRLQPLTIAKSRSASARKRITCQLRRDNCCCRARSIFAFRWAGVGWALLKSASTRSRSAMTFSTSSLWPR